MGKFKTQQMKDKKKAQKLAQAAPSPAPVLQPRSHPAPGGTAYVDDDLEFEEYEDEGPLDWEEEEELDFGDIPVEQRPPDWEAQLRAQGCDEDWIAAYRPPAPEVPTPAEGMERVIPWKCHMCNRFRLEFWRGEDALDDMENAASSFDTQVQEDEISPYVIGRAGEKWRAAYCHWCDTPVNVVVTGPHRGAQE